MMVPVLPVPPLQAKKKIIPHLFYCLPQLAAYSFANHEIGREKIIMLDVSNYLGNMP
jgi:hypothetical protein